MPMLVEPPRTEEPVHCDSDNLYEIIGGQIVELPPMSTESTSLGTDIAYHLNGWGLGNNAGKAYSEMLVNLGPNGARNRRPDVIFVPFTRWPRLTPLPRSEPWDILPSICVEVVSPSDGAYEIEARLAEYLNAGVGQVWIVYPVSSKIVVYVGPEDTWTLFRKDTLMAPELLPGFELPLSELFLLPEKVSAQTNGKHP